MFSLVTQETTRDYPSNINEDIVYKGTKLYYIVSTETGKYFKHCFLQKCVAESVINNLKYNRVRKLLEISFIDDINKVTPHFTRGY